MIEPRFVTGTTAQFVNVTEARVRGGEANLRAGLFSGALTLGAGYTYIDPKDITAEDVLKYRHRHSLNLSGEYRSGILMFGADYRYLSRMERIDEEFTLLIQDAEERVAISVFDLRAGVTVGIGGLPLTILLNVKNVLQYNYVELIGNMAAPRSYVLTVESVF
jgi:outer membrane receptor protein involved in Fe transport